MGLLLLLLQTIQPRNIQALATSTGRNNFQFTRLIRDLESKGVLTCILDPNEKCATLLHITEPGNAFLSDVKRVLVSVVDCVVSNVSRDGPETPIALHRNL
ncbi:MAG: hypothetical protein AAFQ36_13840 [Pseudomonadota bacterium]